MVTLPPDAQEPQGQPATAAVDAAGGWFTMRYATIAATAARR
jgi:hypothetical protein